MTDNKTTTRTHGKTWAAITLCAIPLLFVSPCAAQSVVIDNPYTDAMLRKISLLANAMHDNQATPDIVLSPGKIIVFGGHRYQVFGRDSCPDTPHEHDCLAVTPGLMAQAVLIPAGSKDTLRAGLLFVRTGQATIIKLTSLLYPDGRMKTFTPPLIGQAGE